MTKRVISIRDNSSFLRESGKMFVEELQQDALEANASDSLRRDWQTVSDWLDCASGKISADQLERVEKAWIAYLAIGLAPSANLQSSFDFISKQLGDALEADRAPTAVMNVFDRLLATDVQITEKRKTDWKAEEARFRPIFDGMIGKAPQSWWRQQPPIVRSWIFGSIVWMAFMTLYTVYFDPFDTSGWDYMDDKEMMQFALILIAPVGIGAVCYAYQRWVK